MNFSLLQGKEKALSFLFVLLLLTLGVSAQIHYISTSGDLLVSGTSTLHNWTMRSAKAECSASFDLNASGQVDALSALSFTTPANALKSDHRSMDKNAYKALRTDKASQITYTMTAVTITQTPNGAAVTCKGKLTMAGTTREEELVAVCKTNSDNSITVTGSKAISMKQYSIDPPTFMLGTVKTGNDIVLTFHLTLKKA